MKDKIQKIMYKTANFERYRSKINELIESYEKRFDDINKELLSALAILKDLEIKDKQDELQMALDFTGGLSNSLDTVPSAEELTVFEMIKNGKITKKGNWYFVDNKKFLGKKRIEEYAASNPHYKRT